MNTKKKIKMATLSQRQLAEMRALVLAGGSPLAEHPPNPEIAEQNKRWLATQPSAEQVSRAKENREMGS